MTSETKKSKWLGYALYVVGVTVMLLYVLFPGEDILTFLDSGISKVSRDYSFKAEKARPSFPAGIRLTAGEVYLDSLEGSTLFKTNTLLIQPKLLGLVKGEPAFDLKGEAYSGNYTGTILNKPGFFIGKVTFKNFSLEELDLLAGRYDHDLTGKLSGEIDYADDSDNATGGKGKAELRIDDGLLKFKLPIFTIETVDLKSIRLEAELGQKAITVMKADLSGPELNGSMSGSIQLHKDIGQSQLNLKGSLEPLAEFYKNYPDIRELLKAMKKRSKRGQFFFSITGTISDPKFKLL